LSIAVASAGKFAYVANSGSDNLSDYILNAMTGALTQIDADPGRASRISPAGNSASSVIIAGNLKDMFRGLVAVGNDVDPCGNIRTGSILIESMTLAGS